MDADANRRITELEVKLSFSEDLLEQLNKTVYRQQQMIDAILLELRTVRQQVHSAIPDEQRSLRDEIPPHY